MTRTKTVLKDDRTEAERLTHTDVIIGRDTFLSGWGHAENKISFAGWACEPQYAQVVKAWVKSRSDMRNVKIVSSDYEPSGSNWHYHIYVVNEGHPSLN